MSTQIDRITELAKEDPKRQFFSIAHLITPEALYAAFRGLRKKASAGVDGVTYQMYEKDAARNIQQLHGRLKEGKYRAKPLRRIYIPKENGKERPISIPSLEDKIVQKATGEVLNAIYEQDFFECSYGFRPGRGPHHALDEVGRVICRKPTSWILEIDITAYFDTIVRATHGDDRKANQRWQCTPIDTEVDSSRSHRRRPITRERNGYRARADDQSAPR
jgi:retron-type reverse transcriptase